MIIMEHKNNPKIDEKKGKLIFKSKTPKKLTRFIILLFFDLLSFVGIVAATFLFINIWIILEFPDSLFPGIIYGLGMGFFGLLCYILTMLILLNFWTYLLIYENGIGILLVNVFPFVYKREYISFKNLVDIKIGIDDFNIETLYIYVKNRDPYELDEFDISDLYEVRSLILKFVKELN